MTKFDVKSAYRRLHNTATVCFQSIITVDEITELVDMAWIGLRMTFGGNPGPSIFSNVSDLIVDLTNRLMNLKEWDAETLYSKWSESIKPPTYLPDNIPYAPARKLLVELDDIDTGAAEGFIDDVFNVFIADTEGNIYRGSRAIPLALDVISRPNHPQEPLPREIWLAADKAEAEAAPTETKIITGWEINTRSLTVSLPMDKFTAWTGDITELLKRGLNAIIKRAEFRTLMGRLENVATFLPQATHFLSRLRSALLYAEKAGKARLNRTLRADLEFWLKALQMVHTGIDINLVTRREPDHIRRTDACEYGLGGYSLTTGLAWRWQLPEDLQYKVHINFLEFLTSVIDIKFAHTMGETKPGDCVLTQGDSSSAAGWLRRTNFMSEEKHSVHRELARELGLEEIRNKTCHPSGWIPGDSNDIADACSRLQDLTVTEFTHYVIKTFPSQLPPNFRISPLPDWLRSEAECWVRRQAEATALRKAATTKRSDHGNDGSSSVTSTDSVETLFSLDFIGDRNTTSSAHSPSVSDNVSTPHQEQLLYVKALATKQSQTWQRPLSQKTNQTPGMTPTERLRNFYFDK